MKKNFIFLILIGILIMGCSNEDTKVNANGSNEEIENKIINDVKRMNSVNWEPTGTFKSEEYVMRGIPNEIGFIDETFTAGVTKKYMWHFWGESLEGNLRIVAVKEGELRPTPVLVKDEEQVWTYNKPLAGINGADIHIPSNMKIPESGKWALLVYLGEKYINTIVVEVE
ncbi:DUF4871 domain-containing protein [Bacillus sp. FJAT-27251]|uniref:DUF4871 domain-containing protein n=1 Tax=Bacillus sp. FJAT-27251 TaxID=1684142 RepID=UPI0006A79AD3|nr:DUF4871 domain-containing protein [Bacillus sp. FJAT-27251]